jgi:hypothetical protein
VSIVKKQGDQFLWRLITVYGSLYEDIKDELIEELHMVMESRQDPTLAGGDFNVVRSQKEKSNGIINFNHATSLNNWIHN